MSSVVSARSLDISASDAVTGSDDIGPAPGNQRRPGGLTAQNHRNRPASATRSRDPAGRIQHLNLYLLQRPDSGSRTRAGPPPSRTGCRPTPVRCRAQRYPGGMMRSFSRGSGAAAGPFVRAGSPDKVPLLGGLGFGFVASLCCGGGLIFGAIGLGAAYSALHVARYIPEALAAGTLLIGFLNWLYYRRKAVAASPAVGASRCRPL